ncbi:unnamed protein product [Lampetra planeri]
MNSARFKSPMAPGVGTGLYQHAASEGACPRRPSAARETSHAGRDGARPREERNSRGNYIRGSRSPRAPFLPERNIYFAWDAASDGKR